MRGNRRLLVRWWLALWYVFFPQTLRQGRGERRAVEHARSILHGTCAAQTQPAVDRRLKRPALAALPRHSILHLVPILIVSVCLFVVEQLPATGVLRDQVADTHQVVGVAGDPAIIYGEMLLPAAALIEADDIGHGVISYRNLAIFDNYHILIEGEQLGELASQYGVSAESIFWSNRLDERDVLLAGDELRIPRVSGVPYIVQPGDTIAQIAAQFEVDPVAILLFAPNRIDGTTSLEAGREIFVPGGREDLSAEALRKYGDTGTIAEITAQATGSVRDSDTFLRSGPGRAYPPLGVLDARRVLRPGGRHAEWAMVEDPSYGVGWVRSDLLVLAADVFAALPEITDIPPPPPRWVWPTYGRITSRFGLRTVPFRSFHNGLDIANRSGTPIVAARAGRVTEAGWCRGYGYCVRISHGEGISTIYGHLLRQPNVSAGDQVEAGDRIGSMGSTYDAAGGGYSTGVHLHFTVLVNGRPVDPLRFLP
ncbi:MAG TPA: M23 family metallopeptidase [Roseiflexaceae bacterium]|nr:M23 family metallopeptidase [Roseiflexaceae bacterium]